jgi:hypothetical protein
MSLPTSTRSFALACCLAPFALLAACGDGQNHTDSSTQETMGSRKPFKQQWQGVSDCMQLSETSAPTQQQGDKGKQVQWSVCQARVLVECSPSLDDKSQKQQPGQCALKIAGNMVSSNPALAPVPFQHDQMYSVGNGMQDVSVPLGTTDKRLMGRLGTPTQWDSAPQVQLALGQSGFSGEPQYQNVNMQRQVAP